MREVPVDLDEAENWIHCYLAWAYPEADAAKWIRETVKPMIAELRRWRNPMSNEPKHLRPLPDDVDHMTKEEFREDAKAGALTPCDGVGVYATATEYWCPPALDEEGAFQPRPFSFNVDEWPEWATHVIWINK